MINIYSMPSHCAQGVALVKSTVYIFHDNEKIKCIEWKVWYTVGAIIIHIAGYYYFMNCFRNSSLIFFFLQLYSLLLVMLQGKTVSIFSPIFHFLFCSYYHSVSPLLFTPAFAVSHHDTDQYIIWSSNSPSSSRFTLFSPIYSAVHLFSYSCLWCFVLLLTLTCSVYPVFSLSLSDSC